MLNTPFHLSLLIVSTLIAPVLSQSSTSCNPLKSTSCPADPALGTSFQEDFKTNSTWFQEYSYPERISFSEDEGLKMTLQERFDNPGLKSKFYIMFGKLEVTLKAAPGKGIVSSFYLQSDDLDEIDLEWIGGDTTEVQTNYFSKGNTTTYSRGQFHGVSEPQQQYHNYTIDWTEDELSFYIDDTNVRTIYSDNPEGYPQSPMYIMTGVWAGGDPSNAAGTIQWAGGLTDYSAAPFSMYIKNVIVTDYSSGSQYVYSDQSGDWSSIQAVDGEVNGRYEEALEQFDILSSGGTIDPSSSSSKRSSSGSYNGLSSSYWRYSTQIGWSSTTSASGSLVTRSYDESSNQYDGSSSTLVSVSPSSSSRAKSDSSSNQKSNTTSQGNSSEIDGGLDDSTSGANSNLSRVRSSNNVSDKLAFIFGTMFLSLSILLLM